MKLLITGVWHLDYKTPVNRKDDYLATQLGKIGFIIELFNNEGCIYICQPGDFFDSYKASDYVKAVYIDQFNRLLNESTEWAERFGALILTVYGQHDLRFHGKDRSNTPLAVLEAAERVAILNEKPLHEIDEAGGKDIRFYGASWGDDLPKVEKFDGINVLLLHKVILENVQAWDDDYVHVDNLPVFCPNVDIFVCGDNHLSFHKKVGDSFIFNCGSLMRDRIDQRNHKPVVYIFDTVTMSFTEHFVPIKPFDEIMDVEKAAFRKELNEKLLAFVEKLSGDVHITGLDFLKNLANHIKTNNISKPIADWISEVINDDRPHNQRTRTTEEQD